MTYQIYNTTNTYIPPNYLKTHQDMLASGQYFYAGSSLHSAVGTCWCGTIHDNEREKLVQKQKDEEKMNERDRLSDAYDDGYECGEAWGKVWTLKGAKSDLQLFAALLSEQRGYSDLKGGGKWCMGFADGALSANETAHEPFLLEDKTSSKR